jgi:hypothetical protein
MASKPEVKLSVLAVLLVAVGYVHFSVRRWAAGRVMGRLLAEIKDPDLQANFTRAFRKNSRWWRTMFRRNPVGWGRGSMRCLSRVTDDVNAYIQKLNDEYTNPSGDGDRPQEAFEERARKTTLSPDVADEDREKSGEEAPGIGEAQG